MLFRHYNSMSASHGPVRKVEIEKADVDRLDRVNGLQVCPCGKCVTVYQTVSN